MAIHKRYQAGGGAEFETGRTVPPRRVPVRHHPHGRVCVRARATSGSSDITVASSTITINQGDDVTFDVIANDEVRITNENTGDSVSFNPFDSQVDTASALTLENDDGDQIITTSSGQISGS